MDRKAVAQRFVDEAVNGGRDGVIEELFTADMAAPVSRVLLGLLAGAAADVAVGELVIRFAVVVLVPLMAGLAARASVARLWSPPRRAPKPACL